MTRGLLAVWTALLLVCSADVAHASPLLELSVGPGMGGLQARHTGASAASAYFNPALLTRARTGLTVGLLVINTNVGVQVAPRSAENEVPDGVLDAFHADGRTIATKPLATDLLQNGRAATSLMPALEARPRQHAGTGDQTLAYAGIGLVLKLLKERLAIGTYSLVPLQNFVTLRSFYVDEREQYMSNSLHPELYGDRLTSVSIAFAAGVRVTDSFSLGVGATLNLGGRASAPVYVANASQLTDLKLNLDVKAKLALTPHLGFAWDPGARWHLSGTLHAPQSVDIVSDFTFLVGTNEQTSGVAFTYFYQPWQASLGGGYDFFVRGDQTWSVSGLLHYERWSKYVDRQSVRPSADYAWADTLSGVLGLRMHDGPLSLGLDSQYKPTPVPQQTGRTNYVDNDRVGFALTAEYDFQIAGMDFAVGAHALLYRLLERSVKKIAPPTADGLNRTPTLVWDEVPDDAERGGKPVARREGLQTNNPGWPGYASVGWVSSGGVFLSLYL